MTTRNYLKEKEKYYYKEEKNSSSLEKIKEFNRDLTSKYPWLIPVNRWTGKEIPGYDYSYTELDDMPEGWRIAFGDQMCKEIHEELLKYNYVDKYKIVQIKEKYGTLRWYDNEWPIGKLSEDYMTLDCKPGESIGDYPQYYGDAFRWIEDTPEHYISPLSKEASKWDKQELEEYNKQVVRHYKIYRVREKCLIPNIISKYEKISARTCIMCGENAIWESRGWISPYCNSCASKIAKDYGTKIEDRFISLE